VAAPRRPQGAAQAPRRTHRLGNAGTAATHPARTPTRAECRVPTTPPPPRPPRPPCDPPAARAPAQGPTAVAGAAAWMMICARVAHAPFSARARVPQPFLSRFSTVSPPSRGSETAHGAGSGGLTEQQQQQQQRRRPELCRAAISLTAWPQRLPPAAPRLQTLHRRALLDHRHDPPHPSTPAPHPPPPPALHLVSSVTSGESPNAATPQDG
jgi:hypothetical protein